MNETTLEADGLRVVFFRQGDRYAHRFDVFDAVQNQWVANCYSLEGTPDDDWPPSPPFQQLHVEDRPTGRVILLIGMAGRTHWSAAVEAAADRRSITFDIAARVQNTPLRLGSEYLAPLAPASILETRRAEGSGVRGKRVAIETRSNCTISGTRIVPNCPHEVPTTISWRYEVTRRDGA